MNVDFESHADVQRKLHQCIVAYKGEPYHCRTDMPSETDHYKVRIYKIPNGRAITVSTQDVDFEARFMPLGYINMPNHPIWLQRSPVRRMTLGINNNTVEQQGLGGYPIDYINLVCPEYVALYNQQYPTWDDAIIRLTTGRISGIAISRDFAMGWLDRPYTIRLYWKNTAVGLINYDRAKTPDKQLVKLYNTPYRSFIIALIRELRIAHDELAA